MYFFQDVRIVTSLLIVLVQLNVVYMQDTCTEKDAQKLDDLAARISIGDKIRGFPKSSSELKNWCRATFKDLEWITKYKNSCLFKLSKQIFSVSIYGLKKAMSGYCRPKSRKAGTFIKSNNCFNKHRNVLEQCNREFITKLIGAQNNDDKKKLPHLCCAYAANIDCLEERLRKNNKCSQEEITEVIQFFESYSGDTVNLICGDYQGDNDKCEKLGAPEKVKPGQKISKSIAIPVADLMASFEEV